MRRGERGERALTGGGGAAARLGARARRGGGARAVQARRAGDGAQLGHALAVDTTSALATTYNRLPTHSNCMQINNHACCLYIN